MLEDEDEDVPGLLAQRPRWRKSVERLPARPLCQAVVCALPCLLVLREAALAAELIRQLISKHFEQNLAPQTASKSIFSWFGCARSPDYEFNPPIKIGKPRCCPLERQRAVRGRSTQTFHSSNVTSFWRCLTMFDDFSTFWLSSFYRLVVHVVMFLDFWRLPMICWFLLF